MSKDYLEERGKALEEVFFAQKNKELLEKVRQDLDAAQQRDALKSTTGIEDDNVLDEVLSLGVRTESLAALSIAPMVLVAWADSTLDIKEREAILSGAEQAGIDADSTASKLLNGWLAQEPSPDLKQTWVDYTQAVCKKLTPGDQIQLREKIIGRCQQVAEAAGGFMGLGSISRAEHEMLADLKKAFEPAPSS